MIHHIKRLGIVHEHHTTDPDPIFIQFKKQIINYLDESCFGTMSFTETRLPWINQIIFAEEPIQKVMYMSFNDFRQDM